MKSAIILLLKAGGYTLLTAQERKTGRILEGDYDLVERCYSENIRTRADGMAKNTLSSNAV